ncbi:MAG: phosphatidylserine/phosphatidylglycerophosphate/cardiolipin synthase family protein [Patescibacteria group bacterium]
MSVLRKTHEIIDDLLSAIDSAQNEILLQIFYIDNDEVFSRFVEKMIEKSIAGIRVYCLVDALGAGQLAVRGVEKRLKDAGVRVEYFNWLTPWKRGNKKFWYFRNHKRSLIIDNKVMHLGGWCIGEKTQDWIEAHIVTRDIDAVQAGATDFWNMYKYSHKTQLKFSHQKKFLYTSSSNIAYTYQAPLLKSRFIYYTHKKLVQNTQNRIVLITPYFSPIHGLIHAGYEARKRGVSIDIYIPEKTDHHFVDLVAKTYIHKLLKAGANVYLSKTMIHAKVCLFDNTAYIGTMNLDTISLRYNFENGLFTRQKETITELEQDLIILQSQCEKIDLVEWEKRMTWFQKLLGRVMKVLRPFV